MKEYKAFEHGMKVRLQSEVIALMTLHIYQLDNIELLEAIKKSLIEGEDNR